MNITIKPLNQNKMKKFMIIFLSTLLIFQLFTMYIMGEFYQEMILESIGMGAIFAVLMAYGCTDPKIIK